ncbi:MAG: hypothetical protein GY842_07850 [bacterium]|nr:hypothetical protein [bacterium]
MREPSPKQLGQIWRNRQPRRAPGAIGPLAAGLMTGSWVGGLEHREAVRACVVRVVDDEFRARCTLGTVDRRSVEFWVDDPTVAAYMRRRWWGVLLEAFERECRFATTPRMRFRYGRGGDRLEAVRNQVVDK